jgi:hypothetical protein
LTIFSNTIVFPLISLHPINTFVYLTGQERNVSIHTESGTWTICDTVTFRLSFTHFGGIYPNTFTNLVSFTDNINLLHTW